MNKLKSLLYKIRRFYMLGGHVKRPILYPVIHTANSNEVELSILLAGDFMLDKRIELYLEKYGLMYPFMHLLQTIAEYDIRALNLETPIGDQGCKKWPNKKFNFLGAPYLAQMIKRAGFDYVSLSNNHIMDYGQTIMKATMKNLDVFGILYSGTTSPVSTLSSQKYKIAFLSFMDLPVELLPNEFGKYCQLYDKTALKKIAIAKKSADIVIVSLHWGTEMETAANVRQKQIAHEIIDAGATIVWGHHPHVVQETERYKNGVIFYSLGNFIFSHLTPKIKTGMMAGVHFKDGKITSIDEHKIDIDNYRVLFAPRIIKTTKVF